MGVVRYGGVGWGRVGCGTLGGDGWSGSRGGSRILERGFKFPKGGGVRFDQFTQLFSKFPMKMK